MTQEIPLTTKEKTIQNLIRMRNDFSDEIPDEILRSIDENNKFKVRRGWFSGLNVFLENALVSDILSDDTKTKVNEYFEWHNTFFCNKKDSERRTTAEDIKRANEIIDSVLDSLAG